jgi:hypothetical protein
MHERERERERELFVVVDDDDDDDQVLDGGTLLISYLIEEKIIVLRSVDSLFLLLDTPQGTLLPLLFVLFGFIVPSLNGALGKIRGFFDHTKCVSTTIAPGRCACVNTGGDEKHSW